MKIRAWRLALGGRKPHSGVDLHRTNSLAKNLPSAYPSLVKIAFIIARKEIM